MQNGILNIFLKKKYKLKLINKKNFVILVDVLCGLLNWTKKK